MLEGIVSTNNAIDISRIEEFESRWLVRLPRPYKDFLLRYYGGRPTPNGFPIGADAIEPWGAVKVFLGLDASVPMSDMDFVLTNLGFSPPQGMIPIANTDIGDYVCIDSANGGRIAYWDKLASWGKDGWSAADFYPVADHFNQFLEGLCTLDS